MSQNIFVVSHDFPPEGVFYFALKDAQDARDEFEKKKSGWQITELREGKMFEGMLLELPTHTTCDFSHGPKTIELPTHALSTVQAQSGPGSASVTARRPSSE